MFALFTYISSFLSKSWIFIVGIAGLFLFTRNRQLAKQNLELKQEATAVDKKVIIQEKVINATENNKTVSLDDNIERMRSNKL